MDSLLTYLFDNIPNTTIILSTLTFNGEEPLLSTEINKQYLELAAKRRARNECLVLADMSSFIRWKQLVDKIHPTADGYKKMASVWWAAIQQAEEEGFLKAPKTTSTNNATISKALEKSLDDSTADPSLPAYMAPPQPTIKKNSNGSSRSQPWHFWTVAFQMIMSTLPVYPVMSWARLTLSSVHWFLLCMIPRSLLKKTSKIVKNNLKSTKSSVPIPHIKTTYLGTYLGIQMKPCQTSTPTKPNPQAPSN